MSAHHFFVDPGDVRNDVVTISGAEAHHAAKVLRVRVAEPITVSDNTGRILEAVVSSVGDVVEADVYGERHVPAPRPAITLVQALTKGEKFDEVVDRVCEVGVSRVVPFVARRSVVRWDESKCSRALERWRAIARAAAKQSRSPWIPSVDAFTDDPKQATRGQGLSLVLHESATQRLRDALPTDSPASVALVVGPEGGLADEELAALVAAGGRTVSLGPRVLRTEVAGLVAAALVAYVYGSVG
jgi:16S rRNA (uracil1498-N3)-methyltransferase